jgi:hypothetical protein
MGSISITPFKFLLPNLKSVINDESLVRKTEMCNVHANQEKFMPEVSSIKKNVLKM